VARKRVDDTEAVIRQQQQDSGTVENVGVTTREPEQTFEEMMVASEDSLSDLASSDYGEDWEDEDEEETEQGKLSEDDEHGWVMGPISKTVKQRMERLRQKQLTIDVLTQPGWGDAADYFSASDMKYCTSEWKVPAVVQLQMDDVAAVPAPTTSRELMECLDIDHGILQMPQVTSRPGSCHIRLGSGKQVSNTGMDGLAPTTAPNSPPIQNANSVEPIRFFPCR